MKNTSKLSAVIAATALLVGCSSTAQVIPRSVSNTDSAATSARTKSIYAAAASATSICGVSHYVSSCNPRIVGALSPSNVPSAARIGQFVWSDGSGDTADFSDDVEIQELLSQVDLGTTLWDIWMYEAILHFRNTHAVAYHGNPTEGQTCAGSKPVGDFLGLYNSGQSQQSMTAQEVNVIFGDPKFTVTSPSSYGTSGVVLAWVYKDQAGHYWVQPNPTIQSQITASVSAWYTSIGVTFPANGNVTYVGPNPPKLPTDEVYATCWPQAPNGGLLG